MDTQERATHQIRHMAGYMRLLADLMLPVPDLQDVDRGTFALVLQEIAAKLDRAAGAMEDRCVNCPHKDEEGRP